MARAQKRTKSHHNVYMIEEESFSRLRERSQKGGVSVKDINDSKNEFLIIETKSQKKFDSRVSLDHKNDSLPKLETSNGKNSTSGIPLFDPLARYKNDQTVPEKSSFEKSPDKDFVDEIPEADSIIGECTEDRLKVK